MLPPGAKRDFETHSGQHPSRRTEQLAPLPPAGLAPRRTVGSMRAGPLLLTSVHIRNINCFARSEVNAHEVVLCRHTGERVSGAFELETARAFSFKLTHGQNRSAGVKSEARSAPARAAARCDRQGA